MQRRTLAILLIVLGTLVVLAVLAWILWPFFQHTTTKKTYKEPPPLQNSSTTNSYNGTSRSPIVIPPANNISLPTQNERFAEDALNRVAKDFVARSATYSNDDNFIAMQQVYFNVTPDLQSYLETERQQLIQDHPIQAGSWGQTTRVVASRIVSGLPIISNSAVEVVVQAQQTSGADLKGATPVYKQATLVFTKNDKGWIVSKITWSDFTP